MYSSTSSMLSLKMSSPRRFFNSRLETVPQTQCLSDRDYSERGYLLDSVQASTMLSNSEFVIMLNQAASDRGLAAAS